MTDQSLDDIMSGRGKPDSDATVTEPTAGAELSPAQAKDRDDKGRFAPRQEPAAADPAAGPDANAGNAPGTVPIQALDAERNRRKDVEERHERELRDMRDQLARLQPKLPETPKPPAPTVWDDPEVFIDSRLTPLQKEVLDVREMVSETMAIGTHGAEAVQAAKTALEQIAATPAGQNVVQHLMASRHPMDDLVKWHKRQHAITEVADDPEAYFQRRLAEWQAGNQSQPTQTGQQPQTPAPAAGPMPTAFAKAPSAGPRGGPEYSGPRPLSEIMKGR